MRENEMTLEQRFFASQDENSLIRDEANLLAKENKPQVIRSWVYAAIGSLAIFCFFYFFLGYHEIISFSKNNGSIIFLALPLFFPFKNILERGMEARRRVMEKLAVSLGYVYEKNAQITTVSGLVFSQGMSRSIQDVFVGSYREYPVRLFSYSFTKRQGKRSQTYTNTVFEFCYGKPLPHIVILPESALNLEHEEIGLLTLSELQKVELEGNFHNFFDLYIEESAQTEVREILTPDVMQYFMDAFPSYIIEFFQDKIYVLRRNSFVQPTSRYDIHTVGISLVEKLFPGLRSVTKD